MSFYKCKLRMRIAAFMIKLFYVCGGASTERGKVFEEQNLSEMQDDP